MNNSMRIVCLVAVLVALSVGCHDTGYACPNCYGDPESSMTDGMNMAIISLLGITGSMLALFAGFFLYLRRRFRLLNQRFTNHLN
jgi:hypothetical protein